MLQLSIVMWYVEDGVHGMWRMAVHSVSRHCLEIMVGPVL